MKLKKLLGSIFTILLISIIPVSALDISAEEQLVPISGAVIATPPPIEDKDKEIRTYTEPTIPEGWEVDNGVYAPPGSGYTVSVKVTDSNGNITESYKADSKEIETKIKEEQNSDKLNLNSTDSETIKDSNYVSLNDEQDNANKTQENNYKYLYVILPICIIFTALFFSMFIKFYRKNKS